VSDPFADALAQARALLSAGDLRAAAERFSNALAERPDSIDALLGQGECAIRTGDFEDARDCFETACALDPGSVPALCALARLLRSTGDAAGAVSVLQSAPAAAHNDADLQFELGLSCNAADDVEGAMRAYRQSLASEPDHLGALVNLGLVYLSQIGDADQAEALFARACKAHPQAVAAQANYGLALFDRGEFERAIAHFDELIRANPETVEYRWNRALCYLQHGDFSRGWQDYELRHVRGGRDVRRNFGLPVWDGKMPAGGSVLVYGEQGVGDEIMFASCLPDLVDRRADVVLECDARLATLFARSFPAIVVHGAARDGDRAWLRRYPALRAQLALGSLPGLFRTDAGSFPAHGGYLAADRERIERWRSRLEAGAGLSIGLSWRGGTRKTRADLRSMDVQDFLPLAAFKQHRYFCLQRGDCREEIAGARAAGLEMQWWPEALDDIEESAALIAALDLVISVDNTVVHLTGALGKPCFAVLSRVPDWRYRSEGDELPWYPSVRLFRQTRVHDWQDVMAAVTAALAETGRER
jgi:Flp pilus assembly protein TadD